jgi:heat shock protein HtpX
MHSPIFKTALFLAILTALLVALGYAIGGYEGAFFFFLFSLVVNVISYWFSEKIVLAMTGARPLSQQSFPELYADIRDLSAQMAIPMPKIYYTNDAQANAFATGRNPNHSSIVFTRGILNLLDRHELRGVMAHELSHIKNRDVLIASIAAVLAGGISAIANAASWTGFGRDDEHYHPLSSFLMILLAPLAAFLIQMAISRQREFAADHTGAIFTRRPLDLSAALQKLEQHVHKNPMSVNPAFSSLYIENPLKDFGIMRIFSTHPPTKERVRRLLSMSSEFG